MRTCTVNGCAFDGTFYTERLAVHAARVPSLDTL